MTAMRMTLLTIAAIMLAGIWLTGFDRAHWVLYIPPAFLGSAGITGICPGLIIWSKLGLKDKALACDLPRAKSN